MPSPSTLLTPKIIDYCNRCPDHEKRAIVAYCCHLAFADKSIRRQEIAFVEAMANQMEVSAHDLKKMAGKARRRRLKIKTPTSSAGRTLLFHLAMRTVLADSRTDVREHEALKRVANQLGISPEIFDQQLNKLRQQDMPPSKDSVSKPEQRAGTSSHAATGDKGVLESLAQNMCTENLQANLNPPARSPAHQASAILNYTLNINGDIELELEVSALPLPAGEKYSITISGNLVCEFTGPLPPESQPMKVRHENCPQKFTVGDSVVIRHHNSVLLSGTLASIP